MLDLQIVKAHEPTIAQTDLHHIKNTQEQKQARVTPTPPSGVRPNSPHALQSRIAEQTMLHRQSSSDAALEQSVSIVRGSLGPAVADAFVLAPLWVPNVGCVGLLTLADLPYSGPTVVERRRKERRRHQSSGEDTEATDGRRGVGAMRTSPCPYVVGDFVDFAKRVGVALGTAVHRVRCRALVAAVNVDRRIPGQEGGALKSPKSAPQLAHADAGLTRTTPVLLWPSNFEASSPKKLQVW